MTEIALQSGSPEIPDKLYFKIGEVSELLGVEPYVLALLGDRVLRALAEEVRHRPSPLPPQGCRAASSHQASALRKALHHRGRAPVPAGRSTSAQSRKALQSVLQQELFSVDPLPEIRKELADILQLLK